VSPQAKIQKNYEKDNHSHVSEDLDVAITTEEDAEILLTNLKHDELTWPEIEVVWRKTTGYRLKKLKTANFSPLEIQKIWPQYMQPLGHKLIDIDFKRLYEKATNMLSTYENALEKLLQIIYDRIKDPSCRKILEEMVTTVDVSENHKNSVVLYVLHALFVPTSKMTYTDSNVKKCLQKFSIKDSQNSFFIVSNTVVEIEEKLKIRRNNKNPIQPCLLIVGTIPNPSQILVYFDETKYKFFSIVKAMDMCFKIYHVFNIEYPLQSLNVWLFIQRFFYNIKLQSDKPCPLVNQIISELK